MKQNKDWLKEQVGELPIVDTVFEANGVSYIDTAVSVTRVCDLIDMVDEPEKVVIPQFVADAFENAKEDNLYAEQLITAMYESSDEVGYWLEVPFNEKLILRAWLDGYEVEKEKLYYIKFSENQYAQKFDGTKIDSILVNDKSIAAKFTKEEIEKMNSNLMALAVEVAE